jgi:hypothetical protein
MTIHTFGDSHCRAGWNNIKNLYASTFGPMLCYTFATNGINISNLKDLNLIQEGDIVIFCFGEIDCRCHIHKYISDNISYTHVIDYIVDTYIKQIKLTVEPFTNIKTCVYNIVPPVEKDSIIQSNDFPCLGTDDERQKYVLYFNKKLKEKCSEYNYIFFDVYDKYTDEKGFLNKELRDDIHIRDGIHIKSFLENIMNESL